MKSLYSLFLILFISSSGYSDEVGAMFFPGSESQCNVAANTNGNNLTTPSTKANISCFNNVFEEARKGFSGTIDAQLDDGKESLAVWDTKFVARNYNSGTKLIRVLVEVNEEESHGLVWIDPTSKESKTGTKIDVQDDNIE